jgi:diacylglycerol kinase family enzyme
MTGALTIVANPAAGSGEALRVIQRLLALDPSARVVLSEDPRGVRSTVAELELGDSDTLAVLGGDGTIHQAVSGLFDAGESALPTMAVLPCGSGNALASALGVQREDDAISALFKGVQRSIDVARLETDAGISHAINVIGWGLPARVTERAATARGAGEMPYTKTAVRELLFGDTSAVGVQLAERPPAQDALGMACLTPHAGGDMPVAPDALLDDGALDLVRVSPTGRLSLLVLFARLIFGKHLSARGVSHELVEVLKLEFDTPQPVVVDGEMLETKRLCVEVLARALRVCSPR